MVSRETMTEIPWELRRMLSLKYPHMGVYEALIWERFLSKGLIKFEKLEYDVRVGKANVPKWLEDKLRALERLIKQDYEKYYKEYEVVKATYESYAALTKLRIDVVGHTRDAVWIIEVKTRAGRSALGQVLSYMHWYRIDYKPTKPIIGAVVCEATDPNMPPLFDKFGIRLFIV